MKINTSFKKLTNKYLLLLCFIIALLPIYTQAENSSSYQNENVSIASAKAMIDEAFLHAEKLGIKISVSIMDAHGNLKAFRRMDGAHLASIKISQGKSLTSASVRIPTCQIANASANNPTHAYAHIPGFIMLAGGLPIISNSGNVMGSIGISGGSGDQDEECARMALKVISK